MHLETTNAFSNFTLFSFPISLYPQIYHPSGDFFVNDFDVKLDIDFSDDFFSNLHIETEVGAGSFGVVSLAHDSLNNHYIIINHFAPSKLITSGPALELLFDFQGFGNLV